MLKNNKKSLLFIVLILVSITLLMLIYFIERASDDERNWAVIEISEIRGKTLLINRMSKILRTRTSIVLKMTQQSDPIIRNALITKMRYEASLMNETIREYKSLYKESKEFVNFIQHMHGVSIYFATSYKLLMEGKDEQAVSKLFVDAIPAQNDLLTLMDKLLTRIDLDSRIIDRDFQQKIETNGQIVGVTIVLFFLSMLGVFVLVRKNFIHREHELEKQTEEIAKTNLKLEGFYAELEKTNHINQSILNTAPDAILSIDIKSTIQRANNAALMLLGYSSDELIFANMTLLSLAYMIEGQFVLLTTAQIRELHKPTEVFLTDSHGCKIPVLLLIKDTELGNTLKYTCVFHDLRSAKEVEAKLIRQKLTLEKAKRNAEAQAIELNQAKIIAQEATKAKTQFLATMSHEIRTPMNGVIGMTEILKETPLNDEQKSFLEVINRSGQNLLRIINDILDYSKLDSHMSEIENIQFDLERVCFDCLELISSSNKDKDIEFIFDYDPDGPRFFMGDPSRIRQVLVNLLANAAKFTKDGLIFLKIHFKQDDALDVQINIEIEDTGIGIKEKAIEHLFDEFTQADSSTTRNFGGTGLGLAISKKIIELMQGDLRVISVYGKGTIFTIDITLETTKAPPMLKSDSLNGLKILFVDDLKDNRTIFERMLRHMGANPKTISDPIKTCDVLYAAMKQKKPFQIVVLDHAMPIISGLQVGINIRKETMFDDIKLMIFSSVGIKGDATLFQKAGFDAYLNKLSCYQTFKGVLSLLVQDQSTNALITQYSLEDNNAEKHDNELKYDAKILLVEDVATNQFVAKLILEGLGCDVVIANNGQEAIDIIANTKFDLIFMDCRMPVMDGYEATNKLRERELLTKDKRMPIIALTANASASDKENCLDSGMDDIITKPFVRHDIRKCLSKWIRYKARAAKEKTDSKTSQDNAMTDKTDNAAIDIKVYNQLKETMGKHFKEMVAHSKADIQTDLGSLTQVNDKTKTTDMLLWAHSLKSPSAYIGAMTFNKLATQLELNCNELNEEMHGDNEKALISSLQNEYALFTTELEQLMQAETNE